MSIIRLAILFGIIAQLGLGGNALAAKPEEKKTETKEKKTDTDTVTPAPTQNQAATVGELLKRVRKARAEEQVISAEREKTFKAELEKQIKLMEEAFANRNAMEAQGRQLSDLYDANEKEYAQLGQLRQQREDNLGEVFGVTRQVAGDVTGVISSSLISSQYADRSEFLVRIASAKTLPNIRELERLWFEMTQEIIESGKVVRFNTKIIEEIKEKKDNQEEEVVMKDAEVIRLGAFTALSNGHYLAYLPDRKKYMEMKRQPPLPFMKAAMDVDNTTSGYIKAGVDPSRGVLLSLTVDRPTVIERIEKGESVGYVIIFVGILGVLLAFFQFFYLIRAKLVVRSQLKNLSLPRKNNPVGRMILAFQNKTENYGESIEVAEMRISEAVMREIPRLERFQSFLRLAVAAGPLLGLIGTVIGMIITFQTITESGASDPKLMAKGIGQAMIATVLGLGIAIPLLFINAGLTTLSTGVVHVLDEQSSALLATATSRISRVNQ